MFRFQPDSAAHRSEIIRSGGPCFLFGVLALAALGTLQGAGQTPQPGQSDYLVKVDCESADRVVTVRFGPQGARVERDISTRLMPVDINGPHGIVFSPDREFYYVSIGHGRPNGSAWKYRAGDDAVLGHVDLGMFPATEDVTPDGNFLYVVNFNLHGDMVPSSVSVVDTHLMMEVARIPTCTMPHGSRINADGTAHYSACMMDDLLVEIDPRRMKVARSFRVTPGKEQAFEGLPRSDSAQQASHAMDHGSEPPKAGDNSCQPTWAQPSADGSRVFVACNKSSEIVEVDAESWKLVRRIPAGPGVYNLGVTRDGKLLIATNKRGPSVSIFEIKTAKELARLPTKRKVVHGVVVSPDNLYAFVTVEGIGSEPGTLEVIDLAALKTVATLDLPEQAAGIDFWKIEPSKSP